MDNNIIKKMGAEVVSQSALNPDVAEHFSPGLKKSFMKIGLSAVMAGLLFISNGITNEAHAGENHVRNATMAVAGLFGLASSGSVPKDIPIDCNVQGQSGMKTAAGGLIGAYAGSNIGQGNGNTAATIAGGLIGAAVTNNAEEERMRRECAKQIAQRNPAYGMGIPTYATTNANQQSPILYQGQTGNGRAFYVTAKDSPGMAALKGNVVGAIDVSSDPVVQNAMEKGTANLSNSYDNLDMSAQRYAQVISGQMTATKIARYAVDDNEIESNSRTQMDQRNMIQSALNSCKNAYAEYAKRRSLLANAADNAAMDGYDLRQYGEIIYKMAPPPSATVCYGNAMPNKYGVVPGAYRP